MNTVFLLMAEFGSSMIPVEKIAEKYFSHDRKKMQSFAREQKYPFPVFRAHQSQKSEWMVSVEDLARYLDNERNKAAELHRVKQVI